MTNENGIDTKVAKKEWEQKGMMLLPDTFAIYNAVKKCERYTDNEMLEFLLAGLLYLKNNKVKFSGFNRGMSREEVFSRLLKYYDSHPLTN
jgi:hypothetical protein